MGIKSYFSTSKLCECTRILTEVSQGRKAADLVILGAKLINVCTREIQDNVDVAVSQGRIALVGSAKHCIGENTKVINANGAYLAPGFLDGHIHVESSMLSVGEYARAVIPHGTVGIYMDPHEICNVLGLNGVKLMIEDSVRTPLKTMVTVPSCVPGIPGFEDTGAEISVDDIREMMSWDSVVGLGEMMNYIGILSGDNKPHDIVCETLRADKIVTGHYPAHETGMGLNGYIATGARCCHESTRAEDALAKMRLGMYAQLREGSAWHDLEEVSKAITRNEIDPRFANLVSDDAHPNTLLENGHVDHILRRAVQEGIDPLTAIQMVTINCAECFRMAHELGSITPGKCADMVFLENLESMKVTRVIIDGQVVAEDGQMRMEIQKFNYPDWALSTMNVGSILTPEDFRLEAPADKTVRARIIEIIPAKTINLEVFFNMPVTDGAVESDTGRDILKAVVIERHRATGKKGFGLVKGFGIKSGAMASTVAHDAHNLTVIGTNDADMALAANTLINCGGGMCAVKDGAVLAVVPLPIAGLMNDKSAEEMSGLVEKLDKAWIEIGCNLPSPYMTMATIPLACIPELRLTNRGIVDCRSYEIVDLFLD